LVRGPFVLARCDTRTNDEGFMKSLVLALAAWVPLALAQQSTVSPNATDAAVAVPPLRYDSAFFGYIPYRKQDPRTWAEVNDEVAQAGGHMKMFGGAYAGHGAATKPAADAAQGAKSPTGGQSQTHAAPPAPAGHTGH
jgi:hypothetical protein